MSRIMHRTSFVPATIRHLESQVVPQSRIAQNQVAQRSLARVPDLIRNQTLGLRNFQDLLPRVSTIRSTISHIEVSQLLESTGALQSRISQHHQFVQRSQSMLPDPIRNRALHINLLPMVVFGIALSAMIFSGLFNVAVPQGLNVPQIQTSSQSSLGVSQYNQLVLQHHHHVCSSINAAGHNILCQSMPVKHVFTVHGLWPSLYAAKPLTCYPRQVFVESEVPIEAEVLWPDILKGNNTHFWKLEFEKHGSCAKYYTQLDYFEATLDLTKRILTKLDAAEIMSGEVLVEAQFLNDTIYHAIGAYPSFRCASNQFNSKLQLTELVFCAKKLPMFPLELENCTMFASNTCRGSVSFIF